MGLAASQARFLGLTARKSNVEYKVQQINQQRTALSNEVLGLYSEYNRLDVPTPPSVNDYNTIVYSIPATYENYKISNFAKTADGYYDVSLTYGEETAEARPSTVKDTVIKAEKTGNNYTYLGIDIGTKSFYYKEGDDKSTITKITGDYDKYPGLNTIIESKELTGDTFYMYLMNDVAYYTSENSLNETSFNKDNRYYGSYTFYYQGVKTTEKTISAKAALTQAQNGNLNTIQIIECPDDEDLEGHTYNITTSKEEDQGAYQDAMNDYNYKKDLYEKEVQEINQKTETLQKEDRALELQLNELDTEQNAISTEMESVSKVIEDTIESVFKTFNG